MRPLSTPPHEFVSRTSLAANQLAASRARTFVRAVLAERPVPRLSASRAITDRLVDDAELLVSELVTNAVMHAGTDIDVVCYLETGDGRRDAPDGTPDSGAPAPAEPPAAGEEEPVGVVVEVSDHHPSSVVRGGLDARRDGRGFGLQLVGALAESWGVTYRHDEKAVWFRLEPATDESQLAGAPGGLRRELRLPENPAPAPLRELGGHGTERSDRGGSSFLAEAGELLAGQLDEDMVAALAGQLLVPRLADWCGVWLSTEAGGMRLSRVWHADERRIDALREDLEKEPPRGRLRTAGIAWPWPEHADGAGGSALAFPLVAGGSCLGMLIIGRAEQQRMTDGVVRTVEDVARRVAQAVVTARQYARQTAISRALQRRQLPISLARIPGIDTALVYEPHGEGLTVGGDFYDLFPMSDARWSFLLGDVQGKDPEAMSVTGLARHLVRLLAREGHGVESVLGRLNVAMAEESAEAVALGGEHARPRFLSLLYGELEPDSAAGGAHVTIASAGHPLPLRLTVDGSVEPPVGPQMLLGIDEGAEFLASSFDLEPGETLLCVTDGVTERRSGDWQLDDNDGLSEVLRECVGLGAKAVAERVRRAAHDFDTGPVEDDLSVLVLQAVTTPAGPPGVLHRQRQRPGPSPTAPHRPETSPARPTGQPMPAPRGEPGSVRRT
ncbi:SpoIIE family protein phosphatase [Streptomyces sp. bgisy100]|uniref:SpoIIE family protein phosphatase n=1 Tax=Streptomyces sp. bgisy100 TaxID=3413783 RepID=UPI003D726FB9